MAFLDDFDKKLTTLGQGAIQKTKDVTDSAKLSSAIKSLEVQKKDAFSALGAIYYSVHKQYGGSVGKEADQVIRRIAELEQQIMEKKDQIKKIKGTIYCPNCNAEVPAKSTFCNICGSRIEVQNPFNMLGQGAPAIPFQIIGAADAGGAYVGQKCTQCGANLSEGQFFCTNCGKKVETDTVSLQMTKETAAPEEKEFCTNCGAEVQKTQRFCTVCGMKL